MTPSFAWYQIVLLDNKWSSWFVDRVFALFRIIDVESRRLLGYHEFDARLDTNAAICECLSLLQWTSCVQDLQQ